MPPVLAGSTAKVTEPWREYRRAYHTSTKELGAIATTSQPGLLVLYHRANPGCDQAGANSGRLVASKVRGAQVAASDSARVRFEREARTAAAVSHDHVVPIFHVGEHKGVAYLVMPLIDGKSLQERIRETGALVPYDGAYHLIAARGALPGEILQ